MGWFFCLESSRVEARRGAGEEGRGYLFVYIFILGGLIEASKIGLDWIGLNGIEWVIGEYSF